MIVKIGDRIFETAYDGHAEKKRDRKRVYVGSRQDLDERQFDCTLKGKNRAGATGPFGPDCPFASNPEIDITHRNLKCRPEKMTPESVRLAEPAQTLLYNYSETFLVILR